MKINKIIGENFITHYNKSSFEINFNDNINIITGSNGSGKTLLIELMYNLLKCGEIPWDDDKLDKFKMYLSEGDIMDNIIEFGEDMKVKNWNAKYKSKSIKFISEITQLPELNDMCPVDFMELMINPNPKRLIQFPPDFLDTVNPYLSNSKLEYSDEYGLQLTKSKKLSNGETRLLEILTAAITTEDILFIDIPEISLHIDIQRHLLDWIEKWNKNLQVILCTHSPSVVNGRWDLCTDLTELFGD
jgi:ABC-type cobalamin/Fe3+-siderophores transport system ATPase subunit